MCPFLRLGSAIRESGGNGEENGEEQSPELDVGGAARGASVVVPEHVDKGGGGEAANIVGGAVEQSPPDWQVSGAGAVRPRV